MEPVVGRRPVGRDRLAAADTGAGEDAEDRAVAEPLSDELGVAGSKSGIGQAPHSSVGASAVDAVADRNRAGFIQRVRRAEEVRDVFDQ
jgi:hypothetical protein